jgi:glucosylceramidase
MEGFGFALTGGSAQLLMRMEAPRRAALLRELFGTAGTSIGVSYLRVSIGSSDMNDHVFTYDDLPPTEEDWKLDHFSLASDREDVVPILKEILAISPTIKILASPWSAPSWMKTNSKPKGGSLRPEAYEVYAEYFVRYIQAMAAQGIRINAITMQNEPLNKNNTPSMIMTAEQQATFLKGSLGPLFARLGIHTKIILYDHNCDLPGYPLSVLADSQAAQYADGSGFHLYAGEIEAMSQLHEKYPAKNLYFTEQMVIEPQDEIPFKIASSVSRIVIGATRNWSRTVLLWNLAADPHDEPHTPDGGCPICQGAITLDGNSVSRNLAFYTIAHIATFVTPGSQRIGSDSVASKGLPNVAFETPDRRKVLLVANTGRSETNFRVRFRGQEFVSALGAGDVGTYMWR